MPQHTDVSVKPAMHTAKMRLYPNREPKYPLIGAIMPAASIKHVTSHCRDAGSASKMPANAGMDTFSDTVW
jgi:hypothetical protein|nr:MULTISPECIES: hypothetical protein [Thermobacillus]